MSTLQKKIKALPVLQQWALEALAVIDERANRTLVTKVLVHSGARWKGRTLKSADLKAPMAALVEAKLALEAGGRYQLTPAVHEACIRAMRAERRYVPLSKSADALDPYAITKNLHGYTGQNGVDRYLRRALYSGDVAGFFKVHDRLGNYPYYSLDAPDLADWVSAPLDSELIRASPPELAELLLVSLLDRQLLTVLPIPGFRALLDEAARAAPTNLNLASLAFSEALYAGDLDAISGVTLDDSRAFTLSLRGLHTLITGDLSASVKWYAKARTAYKKLGYDIVPGVMGLLLPLAYFLQGGKTRIKQARGLVNKALKQWDFPMESPYHGYLHLDRMGTLLDGDEVPPGEESLHPVAALLGGLIDFWSEQPLNESAITDAARDAEGCGYRWLSAELRVLLGGEPLPGTVSLLSHRQALPEWSRKLEMIEAAVLPMKRAAPKSAREPRLVWELSFGPDYVHLEAREQLPRAKGTWSKGRKVALSRLKKTPGSIKSLSGHDHRLLTALKMESYRAYYHTEVSYFWSPELLWPLLVGHPLIFDAKTPTRLMEITAREPRVEVKSARGSLKLHVTPALPEDGALVTRKGHSKVEVVVFNKAQKAIAELLGEGLDVPKGEKERLGALVARLAATFPVSDDAAVSETSAREIKPSPEPIIQLTPAGDGLTARLIVRPLGPTGPEVTPGTGSARILAQIGGEVLRTRRPLKRERQLVETLEEQAPSLPGARGGDPLALEDALTLLTELQALGEDARVEWPEGETLKLRREVDASALSLSIKGDTDWFSASGKLTVDDDLVLQLTELLALVEATPGRFLKLSGGDFVALTEKLRAHLDTLARLSQRAGKGQRFHKLAAGVIAPLVDGAGTRRTDKRWKEQLTRLDAADVREVAPPRTLQAELRPYQRDGFTWLTRLAAWGAGACLADDMGLGKTMQSLALLLQRAPTGPALVVAPTSVCGVWLQEAWRFAPSLTVTRFGGGDRDKQLDGLGPADVVVCSYGLMQSESERLSALQWSTLILDEAQAIKNPSTKRHKAAVALKADFRLATTGTPIENHLGELWALFSFLNPGLLGSQEQFRQRFSAPIEGGSREVQAQLRRLVLPFILRRTKSAVLDDLPPRTDIEVPVVPGPEEASLYEALRRRAVEALESSEDGAQPMQVFAQLTKLRMACCNPRLVLEVGEAAPPSAKLAAFAEIVGNLRENRHRALVFSQFVRHLALLREWLDEHQIPYLYLDGSTPGAERDRLVKAFQAGEGDLFLISLRAGGVGLNLTAADYVVHMDPWWNPAVEDQASDRAHRIGQTRPVTVYRLVTQGTIEEKILGLHRQKRDLADRLLSGADSAAKLSAAELFELIKSDA